MRNIKMLALDVDGVLTNGDYIVGNNGELFKSFNTKDFHGLSKIQDAGVTVFIITGSEDDCIKEEVKRLPDRAKKMMVLNIGIRDKKKKIQEAIDANDMTWENVVYIGDDENDLESMRMAGYTACPNDAVDCIKLESNYIADKLGGNGAVREIIEHLFLLRDEGHAKMGSVTNQRMI